MTFLFFALEEHLEEWGVAKIVSLMNPSVMSSFLIVKLYMHGPVYKK